MKSLVKILGVSVCLLALNTLSQAKDFSKSNPKLIAKGKTVYDMSCASCHGEKGDGNGAVGGALNPKPRNFVDPKAENGKFKKGKTPKEVFNTITNGLPENPVMASFASLSEEERWAVTHYVLSLAKGKK